MVNVGECTRAETFKPRAMPLTSCVLPAPRSPVRPITKPPLAARPQASPSASVSSELCEMNMPIGGQWTHAVPVADDKPRFGRYFTDTTHPELRELAFPRIEQPHGVTGGGGKQQFEIF